MLHFVGFGRFDQRYWAARRVFGPPDFLHRRWDRRACREIGNGDTVVLAEGDWQDKPSKFNGDDEYYNGG